MSSTSPSRILVTHTYAENRIPSHAEVIVVRFSHWETLFAPGSTLGSGRDLPSRATRHNYHHAVVIDGSLDMCQPILTLTVLPMVAYSAIDPISGLSSTRWLLGQPADYQNLHIPVPYEQIPPVTPPHPPFPTPAQFGDGIELGGWKARRPSWIQAVPMFTQVTPSTKFKCYEPPVILSTDEVQRLNVYAGLPPDIGTRPPFPPVGGSGSGYGGVAFRTGGSPALQALYETEAVKRVFTSLSYKPVLIIDSDYDSDDDVWENEMDAITFARNYGAHIPHMAKMVQDHDDKMRERLVEGITSWVKGVQSETATQDDVVSSKEL